MTYEAKVIAGGKIVLPAKLRQSLGIADGDRVLIDEEEGKAVITTRRQKLRVLQEEMRKLVPEGVSLVDELIAERRAEAAREEEEVRQWLARHGAKPES